MNDTEQFEAVLDELRGLLADFTMIGVTTMLVGGQVLALEAEPRRETGFAVVAEASLLRGGRGNFPAG